MSGKERKNFKCVECTSSFSQAQDVKRHIRAVHMKIKDYACHKCGFSTEFQNALLKHERQAHRNTEEYQCDLCDSTLIDRRRLLVHMRRFHCNETVKDTSLKKETPCLPILPQKVKREKSVKNEETEEHCLQDSSEDDMIDENSTSESSIKHDTNTTEHYCLECGFSFSSVDNLSIHMLNIHPNTRQRGLPKLLKYRRMRDQNNEAVKRFRQNRRRIKVNAAYIVLSNPGKVNEKLSSNKSIGTE